jgi:subtilisin family serine protease
MNSFISRFITVTITLLIAASIHAAEIQPAANPITDQYIVVLKNEQFTPPGLTRAAERRNEIQVTAESIATQYRGRTQQVFTDTVNGFSATMRLDQARALARDPRVAYVAQDSWVEGADTHQQFDPPSWGLDRVDQQDKYLDGIYQYLNSTTDTTVHVYVIDSGIRTTHLDFNGRVDTVNAFTAYTDGWGIEDCHGHGTHIAGTIGGELHGVAKNVTLHPVRVLNCWAGGPVSAVIAGVDWVTAQVNDNPHAAVANMSLVAAASQAMDDAVRASVAAGVTYVVAAGNNGADACNYSPARVAEAITVGGSTQDDQRVLSSNYGDCVDIYAPGAGIRSTYNRSDTDTIAMSGTSVAAPHVAGIAALILAQTPNSSPAAVADLIIANATQSNGNFSPDANDLIAYSLISIENDNPEPEFGPDIDFTVDCRPNNQQCTFEATVENNSSDVNRYYWNFGDGNANDHHRPIMRHRYRNTSRQAKVTVILTVELDNGELYMADKTIALPF